MTNVKNMTSEERHTFIQAEAQHHTTERMATMGLTAAPSSSTPKPTLDICHRRDFRLEKLSRECCLP